MGLNLNKGAEAMVAEMTRAKGSGKFVPGMRWEDGETKFIQFITPIEEIPTVLMHRFMIVGFRDDGSPKYAEFISRKDEAIDGPDGYDELTDRFGETAKKRCIALAVELDPRYKASGSRKVIDGFDIGFREYEDSEGNTKEVPAVNLIIESLQTFYGWLTTYSQLKPIESAVLSVTRRGKKTETSYDFMEAGPAIDLEGVLDEVEFDFDVYLEDLASADRMRKLVGPLDDDFTVNPYTKKNKSGVTAEKKKKSSGPASTRARRMQKEESEEPANDTDAPEAEAEAEDKSTVTRSRRFSGLQTEMGTS